MLIGSEGTAADQMMDNILAFIDFSGVTPALLKISREMASRFDMKLYLIYVSTPDADYESGKLRSNVSREAVSAEMHRKRHMLQIMATECGKFGVDATALLVRGTSARGSALPKMLREARRLKPALIVMGTHGHGRLYEALLGSASTAVMRKTQCPVLLVPTRHPPDSWPKTRGRSVAARG